MKENNTISDGSAKSASQRAMRATVRVTRVMRVMRVMRATVQMLRIFICFIYIRVKKFWTNFFLCFFFFFFRFCYNFGENFAYSKSPKMRKKNKNTQKFIKVQDFRKKSEKNIRLHRYSNRYLLTTCHSLIFTWNFIQGKKKKRKKRKEKNSTSISVCWRQEW